MLRITDKMSQLTSQLDLARSHYMLSVQQREATSGRRINQASDDPAGAANLVRIDDDLARVEQCQTTISRASAELDNAEDALVSVTDLLNKARETAIAMANGTYTATERVDAAEEVRQIRAQVIALANSRHDGAYVFSGYQTDTAAYDAAGIYGGDANTRRVLATPALEVEVSLCGSDVFNVAGGRDVLADLQTLADDLDNNNVTGVAAATSALGEGQEQITAARGRLGLMGDRLLSLDSILTTQTLQLQGDRSKIGDANAVETLSELARAQQALNATVKVSASVLSQLTLVDKI
jgi:flagellar hook-associated protein 3 FlgL